MSMIDDIADYIDSNTSYTVGTNIFEDRVPGSPINCIVVRDTGGSELDGDDTAKLKRPTFQVYVRNTSHSTGEALIRSIKTLLHEVIETDIGNTHFLNIFAVSEPGHIGQDDAGNDEWTVNFTALTR